ncbi:HD domain-containing protein [Dysgonomonas sp. 520]|uniref:HD domain-containing protein n=1 Tax=Dysgonomonas sp. 520 TaxID=2302931 RepID=UPI00351A1E1B
MPDIKRKIINDPVFGFITIPNDFLYNIIKHPFLQRLNRIRQMGLAAFVYPGAQHTRLHHSIGAMYLMNEALTSLKAKGHEITKDEYNGALACILLHDSGHGPFSHALENILVRDIRHEDISLLMMRQLNEELNGALDTCISIFRNTHKKKFLHQLVSGQLDVDRLDYLRRDSFYSGVTEGNIGSDRIIKMLDIRDDKLVVESKGIYSVENFLLSRRLMYWQVYLHKTAVAAEKMIIKTLLRAKELVSQKRELFASPAFMYFLENEISLDDFHKKGNKALEHFVNLDDNDIWCSLKVWSNHDDKVLSLLSKSIVERNLFKIEVSATPKTDEEIQIQLNKYIDKYGIPEHEARYLISYDVISSNMYNQADDSIDILYNDGTIKNISEASDMLNIELLSKKVEKYYFSFYRI